MEEYVGVERRHQVPCVQEDPIRQLFIFHNEKIKSLNDMEKRQITIGADVSYIKSRIENGLTSTVEDMHMNIVKLIPVIDRHTALEKRLEDLFWSCVKGLSWTIFAGLIILAVWAVGLGWKPFH